MIGDLKEVYLDNMYHTEKSFRSIDVSEVIDFVQHYIALLLSPRFQKPQMIDSIGKNFDHVKEMKQLFKALSKYISWFNFELVIKLVNTFITDERDLQRKWSTYRDKLKDYFKNNNIPAVQIADSIEFGLSDVPGTKVMIAKVARDDYTSNDLYFFHKLIADALEVPKYKFYFCTIQNGCMELKYSIPDFLYSALFPLTNQQCNSLAEIGIIKITCYEYVHEMKQLPENELKKLHDSPIGLKDEVQRLIDKTGLQEKGKNGWSPPLAASYGGHIDVLCLLIDVYHCDPSQGDDDGVNSLHMASYKGHLNIAQYLVNECHINPDIADSSGNTGLLYSALGGHVDLVIMFFKKKCNVSHVNREGSTLSLLACKSGQVALVDQLKQFDIFSEDNIDFNGCGVVHYCAMTDSVDLLVYLYNTYKSELFQKRNRFGATPLHIACQYASSGFIMKMVNIFGYKVLLEDDYSGCSSLHYLCSGLVDKYCITEVYNKLTAPCDIPFFMQIPTFYTINSNIFQKYISLNINVTKQHKKYNLNVSQQDYKGVVPLALACMSGSINAVEFIINATDIDINITCNDGRTPLHYSCRHGNVDLSQYLIEVQDSDINITHNEKLNTLGHSARGGNIKLVQYLINNYQLPLSSNVLIQAVFSNKLPLIKLLINEHKLNPHVKGGDNMQAVHFAAQSGSINVLEYLVKDCGCDLDSVGGQYKMNVLQYSTLNGLFSLIKYIINNYPQYTSLLHSTDDKGALPIHLACASGVIQLVTFLIDEMKCDITTEDKDGYTCVTRACESGNLDLLKLLINKYNLNPRILGGKLSPTVAVFDGYVYILEWLRQEYHINVVSFKKSSLPFDAAQRNHLYCLKHLLSNYLFDINAIHPFDDSQPTLLHIACQKGHVAIVLYLTSLPQCDVSAKTSNGSTVLHLSCKSHSLPILKHLAEEHQLDLTIKDYNGMAPVHVACEEGSLSIVKYIIDHSPLSLDLTDSFGRTPLLIAAFSKNLPIIRYLNSKNCNISILDDKGFNVIHISAKRGSLDVLRFFIDGRYCNPDITDASGCTPLYLSAQEGHLELVKYLLDSPSYNKPRVELIDMADSNGNTALHAACSQGHPDIVSTIAGAYMSLNIDIYSINEKRQTPLHLAAANGHVNTVVSLLSVTTGTRNHEKLLGAVDGDGCSCLHLACRNDKDSNGFTGVHAACQAGNMRLVLHYLNELKCNRYLETYDSKGLLYFACLSGHLEMVRILMEKYQLKPVEGDIDAAQSIKGGESIVKLMLRWFYFIKLVREMIKEAERRQVIPIATKPRPSFLSS
ncbi:PREDICTED: ankyrin-3-like [Amphimedon queenslandica]|uniref:Uncharacterized protein n=1 Tax=Amphimedon queenslandica TaxID=400682 RepID=A0AAN0JJL9_AMPQE|nr:PREDICTED: ankyrin-3-like [Amphimedon queenslandica]|eukprot:XP_019856957.1 PREDICTED: ankyrin-3-like [Amphimedon queenslandica]